MPLIEQEPPHPLHKQRDCDYELLLDSCEAVAAAEVAVIFDGNLVRTR